MAESKWWHKKEKAGMFLLKLTLYMVVYLPAAVLKVCIFFVTLFYYAVNREERRNIALFRKNLLNYYKDDMKDILSKTSTFSNFYAFSESICDKIAVWKGKIKYEDLVFSNVEYLHNELSFGYGDKNKKGQILLVSHFGNIEVFRAISRHIKETRIAILVYQKNSQAFANIINEISQTELKVFEVSDLSIDKMLELSELLNNGCHIGIMADRISLNDKKNIKVKFLGQECLLPTGAFILAGLLKCPVTTIWCEKINDKYHIDIEKVADKVLLTGNKEASVRPHVEKYISVLEKHVKNNPTQWFNFYNFWQVKHENNK